MKTIEYNPSSGQMFTDSSVEFAVLRFMALPGDSYIAVANATFITAARTLIHEGVVDHASVRFVYKDEVILPNSEGRLPTWPAGFCDLEERLLERLITVKETR